MRSVTSKRSERGTGGGTRPGTSRRYRWSRCWRPISRTSRNPRVVTRAVRAPPPSSIAFVTTVVPWVRLATSSLGPSRACRPATTACEGSGVVGTFSIRSAPPADGCATRSVKVPPTSIPTRTRSPIARLPADGLLQVCERAGDGGAAWLRALVLDGDPPAVPGRPEEGDRRVVIDPRVATGVIDPGELGVHV